MNLKMVFPIISFSQITNNLIHNFLRRPELMIQIQRNQAFIAYQDGRDEQNDENSEGFNEVDLNPEQDQQADIAEDH